MYGEPSELREAIGANRRQAISLRRFLAPQREALHRLQAEGIAWLSAQDRARMREIADLTAHYIEALDVSRDLAAVAQEELHSRLSEQLERRMYTLAIITAIFLPLTFITGLLGINVAGIPGSSSSWGFLGVSGVLALILSGQLWILRRRKWF
jgi:zinc transporter